MEFSQYSAKLDDIHLVAHGERCDIDSSRTLCGKPMLAHNYLALSEHRGYTVEERKVLLQARPRIICEKCLAKLGEMLSKEMLSE